MKFFIKSSKYFILITTLLIASCYRIEGPHKDFKEDLAEATPNFRQGWNDGCEVGRATGGNSFYRMTTSNTKVDGWKMANSKDYQMSWLYGYWYCYRDDHVDQKSSSFRSFFGGMQ